jgi:alpha-beta hydrolase superfamily lysophospholipase
VLVANVDSLPSRRAFLKGAAPAIAGGLAGLHFAPALPAAEAAPAKAAEKIAPNKSIWSREYWAQKGDVKLYMFRKRAGAPPPEQAALPVLFLVHGSSLSGRSSFDLNAGALGNYSIMDKFAGFGFDVWTMDFSGYGKSSQTSGNSNIADGVEDLKAAVEVVARETGQQRFHFFGESSGGLRAGAFAMVRPERVGRLVLAAFTYTGEGSPTLADRAKQLDFYRTHNRRPRDRDMIRSIFTRDKPGTSDPAVAEALADRELAFGDTVPTGTYLDMTANLPVVDPLKVQAPVLLVRGEYDGIATNQDLLNFFNKLPNGDRQFVILPGMAHSLVMGLDRDEFSHVMRAFLEMPARVDKLKAS